MASNTQSFFFKLENSTLTIKDIRDFELGLVAKEGNNGFVEVAISESILCAHRDLEHVKSGASSRERNHKEFDWDTYFKGVLTFLINGLKPNTPPLMHLSSDSFGGFMNDCPVITLYTDANTKVKYKDNYRSDSDAQTIFSKYYPDCVDGYYDFVGFVRHSDSDLISDEQKQLVRDFRDEIGNIEYNRWIEAQESLKLEVLSRKLIEAFEAATAYNCNYEVKNKTHDEVRFIKKYISTYY